MAHRPHPRGTTTNPADGPWTQCMRCGFNYSANRMQFQYQFQGGAVPMNTRLIVCERCLDDLQYQQSLLIIPPDPPSLMNTNPEQYAVDETNWLTTQDGSIFETTGGDEYISSYPNPASNANTSVLETSLTYSGTLLAAYLDLFIGDPAAGGTSVLIHITGSATRTNVIDDLETNANNVQENPEVITITSSCMSTTNVTHIGLYDAATAGTLLTSGPIHVTTESVVQTAAVQFNQLGLQVA